MGAFHWGTFCQPHIPASTSAKTRSQNSLFARPIRKSATRIRLKKKDIHE